MKPLSVPQIEKIWDLPHPDGSEGVLAIIVRAEYRTSEGVKFLTDYQEALQLGYMNRPKGYKVAAHVHKYRKPEGNGTQEVLFLRSGKMQATFYNSNGLELSTRILTDGDSLLLLRGGHGFKMLEDCDLIEVKMGPYLGQEGKVFLGAGK